ncbi:MAG: hypothetical protein EBY83_02915, partial [Verrucomicrobia bacterium]|nr:hypothetical protein [Verrucomicrobiota bacterium]
MIMQASSSLALREIVRFLRQKNRVIGALATPVIFWFLLGSGVGRSLASSGIRERADYLTYFFPGIVLLIILFTAIFSTVSVIEDRREGFLQGVLVAPDGRSAILFGKLIGGTLLAVFQALIVVLIAPYTDYHPDARVLMYLVAMIALLAVGLSLIFGMLTVVNFAHGAFFMVGAFLGIYFQTLTGSFALSLVITPLVVGSVGMLSERFLVRPLYGRGIDYPLLLTFGLSYVLIELMRVLFGIEGLPSSTPAALRGSVDLGIGRFPLY